MFDTALSGIIRMLFYSIKLLIIKKIIINQQVSPQLVVNSSASGALMPGIFYRKRLQPLSPSPVLKGN